MIIIGIVAVYNYSVGDLNIFSLIILLITIPFVWSQFKRYDALRSKYEELASENEKLVADHDKLYNLIQEYEVLMDSLEGVIYSLDMEKNNVTFIKGADQTFGYSNETFRKNTNLWREIIHPEDRAKVDKSEKFLQLGKSTRIEFRILHPIEDEKWVLKIATPIQDDDGKIVRINGQIIDITDRKQLENQLKQMAYFDDLTDLPNRKMLDRHIEKALARSKRHNHNFTLMFVDLDDFKLVNDTLGHDAGDLLLQEVVQRINHTIREEDLIARIGGDEFIIVFEETTKEDVEDIAKRIVENVSLPYKLNEQDARISLSIGISMYPDDGEDKGSLIDHADKAMYYAKNNGKNNYKLYSPDLEAIEFKKVGLWGKWMNALQNSKLFNG